MADLRNIIRELAKPDGETVALVCTVDAVDEKARTIDCTPLNEGAPLLGVNLQANQGADYGFWLYPEVGSFVIVGFVADGAAGVVLSTEKIKQAEVVIGDNSAVMDADGCRIKTANMSADINPDDIIFNGGKLNGLVKIDDLTKRLNIIERTLTNLKPFSLPVFAHLRTVARLLLVPVPLGPVRPLPKQSAVITKTIK